MHTRHRQSARLQHVQITRTSALRLHDRRTHTGPLCRRHGRLTPICRPVDGRVAPPLAVAATPLSSPPPAPQSPPFAAADAELLANAAPKVEVPPVASLVRRTDRPMKDGPTAQWPPAGLGTEVTFPPDTLNKAECGLWVPKRQVAVVGLGGRHQLDSSCT